MDNKKAIQRINQISTIKVIEFIEDGILLLSADSKEIAIDYIQDNELNNVQVNVYGGNGTSRKLKAQFVIDQPSPAYQSLGGSGGGSELLQYQLNQANRELSKAEREVSECKGDIREKSKQIEILKDEKRDLEKKLEFQKERFELDKQREAIAKRSSFDRFIEVVERKPELIQTSIETLGGFLSSKVQNEAPAIDYGDTLGTVEEHSPRQQAVISTFTSAVENASDEGIVALHKLATWLQADPTLAETLTSKLEKQA